MFWLKTYKICLTSCRKNFLSHDILCLIKVLWKQTKMLYIYNQRGIFKMISVGNVISIRHWTFSKYIILFDFIHFMSHHVCVNNLMGTSMSVKLIKSPQARNFRILKNRDFQTRPTNLSTFFAARPNIWCTNTIYILSLGNISFDFFP